MLSSIVSPRLATPLAAVLLLGAGNACAQLVNPYQNYVPVYLYPHYGYISDPYGLHGAADVVRAQGQLMKDQQEAYLKREEVRRSRIQTHRAQLEEWLWERDNLPTLEDERERFREEQLRRTRNDPPITEVWSGKSLNDLLTDLVKIDSPGALAGSPSLSEDILQKINVTTGKSEGNIGIIKSGKLLWPLLLRRTTYDRERNQIDRLLAEATAQAPRSQVSATVLEDLVKLVNVMERKLVASVQSAGNAASFTPAMYVDARGFLHQVDNAVKLLQQPDAANYLNGKYVARGQNVADLVQYMKENGLRFAPATGGSEAAYVALHRILRDFDVQHGAKVRDAR